MQEAYQEENPCSHQAAASIYSPRSRLYRDVFAIQRRKADQEGCSSIRYTVIGRTGLFARAMRLEYPVRRWGVRKRNRPRRKRKPHIRTTRIVSRSRGALVLQKDATDWVSSKQSSILRPAVPLHSLYWY